MLGAAGAMGSWLVEHLQRQGHVLMVSDMDRDKCRELADRVHACYESDNCKAVKEAKVVFISVPISETEGVIHEIEPALQRGTILFEISSLKGGIIDSLSTLRQRGVMPVSIHPLFGPGIRNERGKIAHILLGDTREERRVIAEFFPGFPVHTVDAESHDRAISLTIALPYALNLLLADILRGEDMNMIQELAGTTFDLQQVLMGAVLYQSVDLHLQLYSSRTLRDEILPRLAEGIERLSELINSENTADFREHYSRLKQDIYHKMNIDRMYNRMYDLLSFT